MTTEARDNPHAGPSRDELLDMVARWRDVEVEAVLDRAIAASGGHLAEVSRQRLIERHRAAWNAKCPTLAHLLAQAGL